MGQAGAAVGALVAERARGELGAAAAGAGAAPLLRIRRPPAGGGVGERLRAKLWRAAGGGGAAALEEARIRLAMRI